MAGNCINNKLKKGIIINTIITLIDIFLNFLILKDLRVTYKVKFFFWFFIVNLKNCNEFK